MFCIQCSKSRAATGLNLSIQLHIRVIICAGGNFCFNICRVVLSMVLCIMEIKDSVLSLQKSGLLIGPFLQLCLCACSDMEILEFTLCSII